MDLKRKGPASIEKQFGSLLPDKGMLKGDAGYLGAHNLLVRQNRN